MSEVDDLAVVGGSGNVCRELRLPDAGTEQVKSALAAEIIKLLREQALTTRGRVITSGRADRAHTHRTGHPTRPASRRRRAL